MQLFPITVFYTVHDDTYATVCISTEDTRRANEVLVTVLHEVAGSTSIAMMSDFHLGEASPRLLVYPGYTLTIIVRDCGEITATAILECADIEDATPQGYLFIPHGVTNLLIEQSEQLRDEDLDAMKRTVLGEVLV